MVNLSILSDNIYTVFLWMIILGGGAFIVTYLLYFLKFKHKIRIKQLVNNRKIITDTKARDYKDRDGIEYLQIWDKKKLKGSDVIPKPPVEAVEVTNKGRKVLEVYRDEFHNYFYAIDTNTFKEVPEKMYDLERYEKYVNDNYADHLNKLLEGKDKELEKIKLLNHVRDITINKWVEENRAIVPLKPFTTNQRIIQVNQHRKKLALRGKSFREWLLQLAPMFILAMVFIGFMVFVGDAVAPVEQIKSIELQKQKEITKQVEILQEIKSDIQVLRSQEIAPDLPTEAPN